MQSKWIVSAIILISIGLIASSICSPKMRAKERKLEFKLSAFEAGLAEEDFKTFLGVKKRECLKPLSGWIITPEKIEKTFLAKEKKRIVVVSLIRKINRLEFRDENGKLIGFEQPSKPSA